MTWGQVFVLGLVAGVGGGVVVGMWLYIGVTKFGEIAVNRILDRYEDRVTKQSLDHARRLVDANRTHPARPDAGPPAKIHKAQIGSVPGRRR